jgi:hypothetical protein
MRPFTILLKEKGRVTNRGMMIEPIIDDVISEKVSQIAKVSIVGEFGNPDEISSEDESQWHPLCTLANIHWMAVSGISESKLNFLKSLSGQAVTTFSEERNPTISDDSISGKKTRDCLPLLQASHVNLYRENTFRITGLPVDATAKQVAKRASELKVLEELGFGGAGSSTAFSLEPSPSVDQIREAMQRLKDPEHRLIDEFFWFWPCVFGSSTDDPAIQALLTGDAGKAQEIWTQWESDPQLEYVAWHNIAVMFHLIALDWTHHQFANEVEEDRERKIRLYWKESFSRWEKLVADDRIWDVLKSRIRSLDDARLTTGFARRVRDTLPQALDKINAEVALQFAEQGRMEWAKFHTDFMKETHKGLHDTEKTSDAVLAPSRNRITQQIKAAKDETNSDAGVGVSAAKKLQDLGNALKPLFELFYNDQSHRYTDLFDELAMAIVDCLVSYRKMTGYNPTFVLALKDTLIFATSKDVVERINKNIQFGQCQPLNDALKIIAESKASAASRCESARKTMPQLVMLGEEIGLDSEAFKDVSDYFAIVFKSIAVAAYNDEKDNNTASLAIRIADKLAHNADLKTRILGDIEIICSNTGDAECFFCNERRGSPKRKILVPMHRITEKTAKGVRYSTNNVSVPRCERCYRRDNRHWLIMCWGLIGGAIIGAFSAPFGATGGVAAIALFLLGLLFTVPHSQRSGQAVGYLLLLMLVFGFALCGAMYDSDLAKAVSPNMLGGALVGGLIVFWVAKRKTQKQTPQVRAAGYSQVSAKVREGWQFGEKPFGYT